MTIKCETIKGKIIWKYAEEDILAIMVGLARQPAPVSFSDILRAVALSPAALKKLLRSLQDQNLIDFNLFNGYTVSEYYQELKEQTK
jgi:DNA-binding IclR family transcriptional regulator